MSNQITIQGILSFNGSNEVTATVKLWEANSPVSIAECEVDKGAKGEFSLTATPASPDAILYIVAELKPLNVVLLSVLSPDFHREITTKGVVVNEFTTVASAFTCAQFFSGLELSGNHQGIRIAAKNTPNFVNPVTGTWGDVITDPFNITQNETLARFNTLAALITAYGTGAADKWQHALLDFSTPLGGERPGNTAEAMIGIAQSPWMHPAELFHLFDKAYPQPKDGFPAKPNSKVPVSRRSSPFVPYLSFAPEDFAMILVFGQGGICAPGKLALDKDGNLWTGLNWMPGAQNGVYQGIGGGLVKLDSTGKLLSPPVTGYTGMGVDGVGWGTAITNTGTCWTTSFNGAIGVYKLEDGSPIVDRIPEKLAEKLTEIGGLQGIGVAPNGDIWVAGTSSNEMLYFPNGELKEGEVVTIEHEHGKHKNALSAPFAASIDHENRVWISNTNSKSLIRYSPADEKVERFILAGGGRGVALDSKGNCWVACNTSPDFPPTTPTDNVSIIEGFALGYPHLEQTLGRNNKTGSVFMIPSHAKPIDTIDETTHESDLTPYGDGELNAPWGISVDGNDDVWVANFMGRGVSFMAGASASKRTESYDTGDVIHTIHSGSIQMLTDVIVDQAGNLWCANNWNLPQTVMQAKPNPAYSTWGGGSGVLVVYGITKPVQVPLIGPVKGL